MFFLVVFSTCRRLYLGISIWFDVVDSTACSVDSDEVSLKLSRRGVELGSCVAVGGTKIGACELSGDLFAKLSNWGMSSEKPKAGFRRDKLIVWLAPLIRMLA